MWVLIIIALAGKSGISMELINFNDYESCIAAQVQVEAIKPKQWYELDVACIQVDP